MKKIKIDLLPRIIIAIILGIAIGTIFPAPLAQAATFEPELTKEGSEIAQKRQRLQAFMWLFLPWQIWYGIPDGGEWWNLSERIRISVPVL